MGTLMTHASTGMMTREYVCVRACGGVHVGYDSKMIHWHHGGGREAVGMEGEVTEGMEWWQREARLTGGEHAQVKECGADANAAAVYGTTPLMIAAMGGHMATAVALVRTVLGNNMAQG